MRTDSILLLPTAFLAITSAAFQLPDFQPFLSAIPLAISDYLPGQSSNQTAHEVLKRQTSTGCPTDFNSCSGLGAAGLCCAPNAVCSADAAGHVACCPKGYACSGTINGVITAGTLNSNGAVVGSTTAGAGTLATTTASTTSFEYASSTTTGGGLVVATTVATGTGGFVLDGTSTVATPAGAVRAAAIPPVVQAIVHVMEYIML
ncbi:Hypothetical protein R9X50_00195000 [Acrodontium crateriforme]|uniref:Uncharacterized protein n=1 Tax=Acrodontium crateriforme TaxID=150365 RepID=A0AAQ3M082_9PEZI|nr:Hypothetical protein R9X50_00195000 [Acrodontium crateriforme]